MSLGAEQQKSVLDAAIQLASRKDLAEITLDELARESGIGAMQIAMHYKSREKILVAALDREVESIAAFAIPPELRLPGESLRDEVGVLAKIMLEGYRSRLPFLTRLLTEAMRNPEAGEIFYRSFIQRGRVLFTEFLHARKARGELREDLDLEVAAAVFLAALTSVFLVLEVVGGKRVEAIDDDRLIHSMSDVFLRGIGRGAAGGAGSA